jgi:hypothetical protein
MFAYYIGYVSISEDTTGKQIKLAFPVTKKKEIFVFIKVDINVVINS